MNDQLDKIGTDITTQCTNFEVVNFPNPDEIPYYYINVHCSLSNLCPTLRTAESSKNLFLPKFRTNSHLVGRAEKIASPPLNYDQKVEFWPFLAFLACCVQQSL